MKSFLWWLFAIIFTIAIAVYQRVTGPTHPLRGKTEINGQIIKYKLPRSAETSRDAKVFVVVPDTSVHGSIKLKRYKSHDEWTQKAMIRQGDTLLYWIEKQPASGKMMYKIQLETPTQKAEITDMHEHPIFMRFKGAVPNLALIPHILFMFLAMLFSSRTGIEALCKGKQTFVYAFLTLIFLGIGGFIFGAFVQKYAFGYYWSGFPMGNDLTDNKTLIAFVFWIIAVVTLWKNRENRTWAVVACIVLLAVYLIPHSIFGSEFDYTQQIPK